MVAKGMAALFAKVQANPKDERLLNRVLALIADIRDVSARAAAALELSTLLVDAAPREAMRLAHMVYRADRTSLQALEVVIACLKKLGRAAKAEILTNELRKLHGLQKIEGPPDADRQVIMTPRGAKGKKPSERKPEFSSGPEISQAASPERSHRRDPVEKKSEKQAEKYPGSPRSVRSEFSVIAPLGDGQIIGASANNIPGFSELDLKEFSQIAAIANATPGEYVPDAMPWGSSAPERGAPPSSGVPASGAPSSRPAFERPEPTSIDAAIAASMDNPDELFQAPGDPRPDENQSMGRPDGNPQAEPRKTVLSVNLEPGESPSPPSLQDEPAKHPYANPVSEPEFGKADRHTQISAYKTPVKKPLKYESARTDEADQHQHEDANEDMIAAAELFDYYWQQGFMKEARDLLNQTAAVCSEAHWWRARKNLLRSSRIGRTTGNIREEASQDPRRVQAAPAPIEAFPGLDARSLLNEPDNSHTAPAAAVAEDPAVGKVAMELLPESAAKALPGAVKSNLPRSPLSAESFWPPLLTDLASLSYRAEAARGMILRGARVSASQNSHSPAGVPTYDQPADTKLDPSVAHAIEGVADQAILWEMVQALWAESPGQDCLDFLRAKQLTRSTAWFWGCYLDALLGTGQHRFALQEVRTVLRESRQLPWATVAYARIPQILNRLSVRSIVWEEADGVTALIEKISKRQPPLARGIFVGTEK